MIAGAVCETASRRRAEAVVLSSLTIRGWPRRIEAAEPLPHPFRRAYQELHLGADAEPCVLYSPRARFGPHESTAKLLVWAGERLACLDARHGGVVTTTLSLDEIHEVEWGQALLEAWLRLCADGPGGRAVIRVEFNAIGLELYKPIADTARSAAYEGSHLSLAAPALRLAPLAGVDARFATAAGQALPSGVELRRRWFQPRAGTPLRLLRTPRVAGLLLLVTQAELILVEEQTVGGIGRYGTVWRCAPLRRIQGVTLVPDPVRRVVSLRVRLPADSEIRADVDPARTEALCAVLRETDPRWGELESPPSWTTGVEPSGEAPPP